RRTLLSGLAGSRSSPSPPVGFFPRKRPGISAASRSRLPLAPIIASLLEWHPPIAHVVAINTTPLQVPVPPSTKALGLSSEPGHPPNTSPRVVAPTKA